MEPVEMNEPAPVANYVEHSAPVAPTRTARPVARAVSPQACPTCGAMPTVANGGNGTVTAAGYVYAIGRIEPRFPRPSVEKEFAQVAGKSGTAGLTDRQALQKVLSHRQNRYLARQLCWVMTIEGLETYILVPHDPADLDLLLETVRGTPTPMDLDVVVGARGPIAAPGVCNGLQIPIVVFDQIYSFDRESLIKAIPRPDKSPAKEFAAAAEELFDRIMHIADNAGATDEHRALNYLAVRYQAIYAHAAEAFARNAALTAVEVRPSVLSGARNIVEAIFSYTDRATDVMDKYFARVDITEEFPYLVTKLSPYYDR